MMKKMRKLLICLMVLLMIVASGAPVAFAEAVSADGGQPVERTSDPAQASPAPATEAPTPSPTATQEPPTATPAPTQEPPAAVPAQESAGTVDMAIFAYDADNRPAEGYTVQIDATKLIAGSDGRVDFPGVTVEQHNIKLIDTGGAVSEGVLVMSRGDQTVITGAAMGGKYGLSVSGGAAQIYVNLYFKQQAAVGADVSDNKLPAPSAEPAASASPTAESGDSAEADAAESETKQLIAVFTDEDGGKMEGLDISVETDGDTWDEETDGKGRIELYNFGYGMSRWAFDGFDPLTVEMSKGVQTSVTGNDGGGANISVAPSAAKVYLEFEQSGDRFVLKSVSESSVSGMPIVLLAVILGAIVVAVIAATVTVRKHAARKQMYAARTAEMQQRRTTGGGNKFENSRNRDRNFDDRSRM